jgi:hypothetical protein
LAVQLLPGAGWLAGHATHMPGLAPDPAQASPGPQATTPLQGSPWRARRHLPVVVSFVKAALQAQEKKLVQTPSMLLTWGSPLQSDEPCPQTGGEQKQYGPSPHCAPYGAQSAPLMQLTGSFPSEQAAWTWQIPGQSAPPLLGSQLSLGSSMQAWPCGHVVPTNPPQTIRQRGAQLAQVASK